jgi:iron complex outermembrane receptor protein
LLYEVGGKVAIKGLTATLAFYQIKQPMSFNAPTPTATSPAATTVVVDGKQRNRCVELGFNGEPTSWPHFIGGLSVNDAEQTKTLKGATDGEKAIGVLGFQASIGAEIVPPFLKLTARMVKTGHQYLDVTNLQRVLVEEAPGEKGALGHGSRLIRRIPASCLCSKSS